jgi:hypothetical protein
MNSSVFLFSILWCCSIIHRYKQPNWQYSKYESRKSWAPFYIVSNWGEFWPQKKLWTNIISTNYFSQNGKSLRQNKLHWWVVKIVHIVACHECGNFHHLSVIFSQRFPSLFNGILNDEIGLWVSFRALVPLAKPPVMSPIPILFLLTWA